jgi:glycosyltransferase involved in cell wall biosynthesis
MKVLFIVPGSGDPFYCGNCFRDNLHAAALRRAGHEVIIMPLYLPLNDPSFSADTPLFFPAASLFLSQRYFQDKTMPRWMEWMLNSNWSLAIAASFSGTTSSEGMEGMTLSMIRGDDAVFAHYVRTLVDWIRQHERPDVVHLSSSLLIGIARVIKSETGIPVVCALQDEEVWIDPLGKYAGEAWRGIEENMSHVDRFIASSAFYAKAVRHRFPNIGAIDIVYPGLQIERYASPNYPDAPTIGFFYRMNELNGLHILAEAFVLVKRRGHIPSFRLRIGGGYSSTDKPYLKKVRETLAPFARSVTWIHDYTLSSHADFYRNVTAVCVPVTFDEAIGLYVCEAFAAQRPVVEPATGSLPETVSDGGILYSKNTPESLAEAIERLFLTPKIFEECRKAAINLAQTRYADSVCADALVATYDELRIKN